MENSETKPIKRHSAIVKFSQEHHFGLLLVWKIREGIKKMVATERLSSYAQFIFENNLKQHFREEEALLFVKLKDNDPLKQRATGEHQLIYQLIEKIKTDGNNLQVIVDFADLLDKHIRFEERELFQTLQNDLSEAELNEIAALHSTEKIADADNQWDDHFWVKNL